MRRRLRFHEVSGVISGSTNQLQAADKMKTYLILTVGTGTAGPHSNLAAGLRRTVELIGPEKFWLVPSTDEVSVMTAELVREDLGGFVRWTEEAPDRCIGAADSLEDCRRAVREVIVAARAKLPKGVRLLVNPTSGTKQMSVGAALAALDEGIGEIVFTVGERADGVVKTGTETLEMFAADGWFAERDLKTGMVLAESGSLLAAATLLERHEGLAGRAAVARCLHEWERQNYVEARRIAAGNEALASCRRGLEALAKATGREVPDGTIVADLLETAGVFHGRKDYEASLILACRALEMGLRYALFARTGLREPYSVAGIGALGIPQGVKDRCRGASQDGQTAMLNLGLVAQILQQLGEEMGTAFLEERDLRGLVKVRNELMHRLGKVRAEESKDALRRVRRVLKSLPLPVPIPRAVLC